MDRHPFERRAAMKGSASDRVRMSLFVGEMLRGYLVARNDTLDESLWRTELGWPVFHLTAATHDAG